jgi:serine/threonine-protein kinase
MANSPVSTVGKYQILELVGEGAMGNVYRAQDPVLNRSVAIKVMSDAIARDSALRDRFMREAQAAGSLQHPNVVTIYDFGEFEGHLYIAMEFVDGVDLEEMIARRIPMTLDQRLGIVVDVLLGLSYAHRHGVVHRDIKPANVRITPEGRAKIMDFGVAHLDSAKMTATGVMVGTPNYMAPEQVTGQKIGPATDLFAVGAVLYELISHQKAFGADSLHNVLFKVVSEDPPPLAIAAPDSPPGLDPIVRRALAKESADRYQTAQEMANDVAAVRAKLANHSSPSLSLGATIASHTAERQAAQAKQLRGPMWGPRRVLALSGVAALALVAATWIVASNLGGGSVTRTPDSTNGTPLAAVPPAPSPPADSGPAAISGSPAGEPKSTPRNEPQQRPATPPTGRAAATDPPDREVGIVNTVRTSVLQARARAAAAGATTAQLAVGDTHLEGADRHAQARRYTQAVSEMNAASVAWASAEREALQSAAEAARRAADDSAARARALAAAPAPVVPPPVPAANPTRSEPAAPSPNVEIAALVADYARAIQSRDLAAIRAVYPGITEAQATGFTRFFAQVRSLRASLLPEAPTVDGNAASARVTGTYEYVDAAGKAQRQPVSFSATFRKEGTRWRMVAVR